MICRASRDRLALALRQYVSGRLSNDDLDDIEVDWRDRGAVAVKEMAWGMYSDMYEHHASGEHRIIGDDRTEVAKWIVFLHSDFEYLWPEYSFRKLQLTWLDNLITLGILKKSREKKWNEFSEVGAIEAWPFISLTHLNSATEQPRYFSKSRPVESSA